jgi:RHH-type transcriptional regulator, rel operon repressor / antitoxin RelB
MEDLIMLAIRLPDDIETRLAALADQTGRTKTFYAREAILTHLEDLEDYYLAAQIVSDIRKGAEKTYRSEDVRASLGLDN